jgi:hypothetical protein
MSSAKLVNAVVAAGVSARLRAHGFGREGLVFRRKVGAVSDVLQVQISGARFVLNLGAYHPEIERLLHERVVAKPSEPACTIRRRVGPKGVRRDPWWTIKPGEEDRIAARVVAAIEERALPWFEAAHDLAALSRAAGDDFWTPNLLTPAAIALAIGDSKLAATRVRAAVTSIEAERSKRGYDRGPFGTDVLELAARLRDEHGLT